MTSAQLMQPGAAGKRTGHRALASICAALALLGCQKLKQPAMLHAPYEQRQLWAVVPFNNESGVSTVDTFRFADLMAQQAEQVYGVDTVPVNRVIAALRNLDLPSVDSTSQAMLLMNTLDVDGVIIGTITAYDPYPPPTLGAAAQLHLRNVRDRVALDPRMLERQPREVAAAGELGPVNPVAQAAGLFDARNHQTLVWLNAYAVGRTEPGSAYGPDIYLVSIELYTQFVCHRLLHDLLASEQARVSPMAQAPQQR